MGIAVIHSLFNIAATLVLLPFSRGIEKLACLTVKETKEESVSGVERQVQMLDVRFLETPALAMEQCRHVSVTMAKEAGKALESAVELIMEFEEGKAWEVVKMEEDIDRYEDQLSSYLVKVSSRDLSKKDSQTLNVLLHCIGDFERISDHAVNLMEAAREMAEKKLSFSKKATEELQVYTQAVLDIARTAVQVFEWEDKKLAAQVEPMEEVVDELDQEVKRRHIKRLRKGKCTIELGFILSDITNNYERVSDHCSNIAVCVLQGNEEEFDTHEYLNTIRDRDNLDFKGKVLAYRQKYQLPQ